MFCKAQRGGTSERCPEGPNSYPVCCILCSSAVLWGEIFWLCIHVPPVLPLDGEERRTACACAKQNELLHFPATLGACRMQRRVGRREGVCWFAVWSASILQQTLQILGSELLISQVSESISSLHYQTDEKCTVRLGPDAHSLGCGGGTSAPLAPWDGTHGVLGCKH